MWRYVPDDISDGGYPYGQDQRPDDQISRDRGDPDAVDVVIGTISCDVYYDNIYTERYDIYDSISTPKDRYTDWIYYMMRYIRGVDIRIRWIIWGSEDRPQRIPLGPLPREDPRRAQKGPIWGSGGVRNGGFCAPICIVSHARAREGRIRVM